MGSNEHKLIEILAPAGSVESMKAAFHAGADAVYMGGSRFGARAFANNPEEEDLKKAIDYAHIHGKKLYLTMNTLFKDRELEEEAYEFLKPYYEEGLDGIIIQDLGLMNMLKASFPKLPLHGSTQMTITGLDMAQWLEKQGLERIVLSRELTLPEIEKIRQNTMMELEVFVQGALCYCYSGQCLMSSFIGGRSGNRGRCAQPCRLPYQVNDSKISDYILSPKDICTLTDIPNLVDAGVNSYKIEGRMKKPEYAALTAWLYRHYVDQYLTYGKEKFHVDGKDIERLMDLYNRGGFSGGYLHQHNSQKMVFRERPNHMGVLVGKTSKNNDIKVEKELNSGDVLEVRGKDGKTELQWTIGQNVNKGGVIRPQADSKNKKGLRLNAGAMVYRVRNQKLIDELHNTHLKNELKESIDGTLNVFQGAPISLNLTWNDHYVSVEGIEPQPAKNQPMSEEQLKKPILKTGNTPFVFNELTVNTDDSSYVPNSQLNDLRRQALTDLEKEFLGSFKRQDASFVQRTAKDDVNAHSDFKSKLHIMLSGQAMLKKGYFLAEYPSVKRVYLELHEAVKDQFKLAHVLSSNDIEVYYALPSVFREKDREKILTYLNLAKASADGWLVRQPELALIIKQYFPDDAMVTDTSIYAMNHRSKQFLMESWNAVPTAPVELNYSELKALGCSDMEVVVYGHQTLMTSAQCIKKNHDGCTKKPEMLELTDRQHKHFYAYNECEFCYNKIYNGLPTMLLDKKKELLNLNPVSLRLHFTMESENVMRKLIELYESIYVYHEPEKNILKEFTRGHFTRGIE